MLGVIEEIALAALVGRVPIYYVEVRVCGEWWRGGDLDICVVEETVHVAWEPSGLWWTWCVRYRRTGTGAMHRIDRRRVVGGIGRRSVSRTGAGASQRTRRVVIAIRIVVAVHGGRVGFVGA